MDILIHFLYLFLELKVIDFVLILYFYAILRVLQLLLKFVVTVLQLLECSPNFDAIICIKLRYFLSWFQLYVYLKMFSI